MADTPTATPATPDEGFLHSLATSLGIDPEAVKAAAKSFYAHPLETAEEVGGQQATELAEAAKHPIDTAKNVAEGVASAITNPEAQATAKTRFKKPGVLNKLVGAEEYATSAIPLVGGGLAKAEEQGVQGNLPGEAGTMVGTLAPVFAGEAEDIPAKIHEAGAEARTNIEARRAASIEEAKTGKIIDAKPGVPAGLPAAPEDLESEFSKLGGKKIAEPEPVPDLVTNETQPPAEIKTEGPAWDRTHSAFVDGEKVGSVGYKLDPTGRAQIYGSQVNPELRGQGIGQQMYRSVIDEAREAGANRVTSDSTNTTPDANRVWDKLQEKGLPVENITHPNGKPGYQIDFSKTPQVAPNQSVIFSPEILGDTGKYVGGLAEKPEPETYHPDLQKVADKYGVSDDAQSMTRASFITPDGKFVHLPTAVDHPDAIRWASGQRGEVVPFLNNTGAIRVRFNPTDKAGPTSHISVPAQGVTAEQIPAIQQAITKAGRNGNVVLERADVTPETADKLTMTKEFPRASETEDYLRQIQAHPDQAGAPLQTNEVPKEKQGSESQVIKKGGWLLPDGSNYVHDDDETHGASAKAMGFTGGPTSGKYQGWPITPATTKLSARVDALNQGAVRVTLDKKGTTVLEVFGITDANKSRIMDALAVAPNKKPVFLAYSGGDTPEFHNAHPPKEFSNPEEAIDWVDRQIPTSSDLLTNERQSELKEPYSVKIQESDGTERVESIEAFSPKNAIATAQKQFPTANEWGIESFGERTPSTAYTVPTQKPLSIHPLASYSFPHTVTHELGHALIGQNEGLVQKGMLRHTHPDVGNRAVASVGWKAADLYQGGRRDLVKSEKLPAVVRTFMGGIAADEAFNDMPRSANVNLSTERPGSDGNVAYRFLRAAGYDHDQAMDYMHQSIDYAKEYLTKPAISGLIKENVGVREKGLSTQYHFSSERLANMHAEAQRRLANGPEESGNDRTVGGGRNPNRPADVAAAEKGTAQAPGPADKEEGLTTAELQKPPERGEIVDGEDVVKHVQQYAKPPYQNESAARDLLGIDAAGQYELKDIPTRTLKAGDNYDSKLAREYATRKTAIPAIVLDQDGKTIVDGNHRVAAAKIRGDKTIKAFVALNSYQREAENAQQIVDLHKANGGSSFNLTRGNLAGTDTYAVSTNPERGQVLKAPPTAKDIQKFISKNQDLLKNPDKSVGTWADTSNGTHVLDVVSTPSDREEAIALGKQHNQKAIFDLKKGEEINTGGTGEPPKALPPQPKLPEKGQFAAIQTDDGAIYPDLHPEKQRTHIMLADDLGIPPERITGGGWLNDGVYEDAGYRSDAGRYGEQARAKISAESHRAEAAQSSTVSTRVPTKTVKGETVEDHTDQSRMSDMEAAKAAPGYVPKMVARIQTIPGFKAPEGGDAQASADAYIRHVADNVKFVHSKITPKEIARDEQWYPVGAHNRVQAVAKQHGFTPTQIAGVTAVESPMTDWDQNTSLAERTADIWKNQQNTKFTPEMQEAADKITSIPANAKFKSVYKSLRGKTLGQLPTVEEQAHWLRLYDEAHNPRDYQTWNPDGTSAGLAQNDDGTPRKVGWSFQTHIEKAIRILKDGSPESISKELGYGHKVRNFYNNMIAPDDPRFLTVDTHAVNIAQLRPMAGKNPDVALNFGNIKNGAYGLKGVYPMYDAGYRLAAKELDIPIPSRLQSPTWVKIREVFNDNFKTPENLQVIDSIWKEHTDGHITADQARNRVWDYATRWNDQATAEAQHPGNAGELPQASLFGEPAAGTAGRGTGSGTPGTVPEKGISKSERIFSIAKPKAKGKGTSALDLLNALGGLKKPAK